MAFRSLRNFKAMKKILFILVFATNFVFAQKDLVWDITDSSSLSKADLYSATKLFIAKEAYAATNVIQNDDKEAGIILLKGTFDVVESISFYDYHFIYRSIITFKIKDNKFKIMVSDLYCDNAYVYNGFGGRNFPETCIPAFDADSPPASFPTPTMFGKKRGLNVMISLKDKIQNYIQEYKKHIANYKTSNDW